MSDVLVQIPVYGTGGTVAVLFDSVDLDALKSRGALPERMIVHRDAKQRDGYKSPEIPWNVQGRRRNTPVSHIVHDIVGQRRRVRYNSGDERVPSRRLDLRAITHTIGPPGSARKHKAGGAKELAGPRFTIEIVTYYQLLDRGEPVDGFDTEDEAKVAAFDLGNEQ